MFPFAPESAIISAALVALLRRAVSQKFPPHQFESRNEDAFPPLNIDDQI
jgi:hypothetical protein